MSIHYVRFCCKNNNASPIAGKKLDPLVLRTRKLIESSFIELLEEEDLHSITIQDITDRATINRSTFYARFDNKYMLFDHIFRQTFMLSFKSKVPLSLNLA